MSSRRSGTTTRAARSSGLRVRLFKIMVNTRLKPRPGNGLAGFAGRLGPARLFPDWDLRRAYFGRMWLRSNTRHAGPGVYFPFDDRRRGAMKRILLATTALATTALAVSGGAYAADLAPVRMPLKAPPVVARPFSWTGCYIGGHLGGGWSHANFVD